MAVFLDSDAVSLLPDGGPNVYHDGTPVPNAVVHELTVLGWGDFNGDGLEDVLVSHEQAYMPGTTRLIMFEHVTRLSPGGPLILLPR